MKNLLFLFLLTAIMFSCQLTNGQSTVEDFKTMYISTADDTITNADTSYAWGTILGSGNVTIEASLKKVSGSFAGNAQLWVAIDSSNTLVQYGTNDTLVAANLYNVNGRNTIAKQWVIANNPYKVYMVRFISLGTSVFIPKATWARRRSIK